MKLIKEFKICTPAEVENWLQIDCDDNGWQPLSDNDILDDRCIAENQEEEEEFDDEISYNDQNCTFDDSIIDDSQDVFNDCQKASQELVRFVIHK
ncbi:Protein of unknown function [Cotesia congregata]|uniref:Uncharacterized protein n=1 Tax=Cotesia congregata TaxID=51543 RepID=A0A8J2EK65_COTCN|nr:Protein of unknown function [Cotesia congregata]